MVAADVVAFCRVAGPSDLHVADDFGPNRRSFVVCRCLFRVPTSTGAWVVCLTRKPFVIHPVHGCCVNPRMSWLCRSRKLWVIGLGAVRKCAAPRGYGNLVGEPPVMRPYQQLSIDITLKRFKEGMKRQAISLPVGSGKTVFLRPATSL